jgi:hypothetical protein
MRLIGKPLHSLITNGQKLIQPAYKIWQWIFKQLVEIAKWLNTINLVTKVPIVGKLINVAVNFIGVSAYLNVAHPPTITSWGLMVAAVVLGLMGFGVLIIVDIIIGLLNLSIYGNSLFVGFGSVRSLFTGDWITLVIVILGAVAGYYLFEYLPYILINFYELISVSREDWKERITNIKGKVGKVSNIFSAQKNKSEADKWEDRISAEIESAKKILKKLTTEERLLASAAYWAGTDEGNEKLKAHLIEEEGSIEKAEDSFKEIMDAIKKIVDKETFKKEMTPIWEEEAKKQKEGEEKK